MRVYVADRSPIVLERLTALLTEVQTVEIVGHNSDGPSALGSLQHLEPEVVIMDATLAGGSGNDLLRSIKRQNPATLIVILTSVDFPQYRERLRRAGADVLLDESHEFARLPQLLLDLAEKHGNGNHMHRQPPTGSTRS
jgi:DNA-binding NarL/FixJ family response regulator